MAKKLKKDFDKDKMYSKIMPSIQTAVRESLPESTPVPARQPSPPPPPQDEGPASVLVHSIHTADGGFLLRNFVEEIMLDKLEHTMRVLRVCTCERCQKDIMAITLNNLPSAYAVMPNDDQGREKKVRGEYEVKVTSALIQAIQLVKAQPRH